MLGLPEGLAAPWKSVPRTDKQRSQQGDGRMRRNEKPVRVTARVMAAVKGTGGFTYERQ
jgi:hypothetical protein